MLVLVLSLAGACKSEEQKQKEEAQKQFVAAAKQMAEAAKTMGKEGAAAGMQGAAAGRQGAAAGMQGAAAAMKQMAEAMKGGGAAAPLVDFRELKALLPEKLGDMKRVEASGEKAGAMGFALSHARGRYKGTSEDRASIKILDTGGLMGPMAFAVAGLAMVEIDKETEDGYEKTTTFEGKKAFEKYNNKSKRGEIKVIVGNRFVVEVDGDELSMDALKAAVKSIDLGKLEGLAPAKEPAK
jgi:hypothetical protein